MQAREWGGLEETWAKTKGQKAPVFVSLMREELLKMEVKPQHIKIKGKNAQIQLY